MTRIAPSVSTSNASSNAIRTLRDIFMILILQLSYSFWKSGELKHPVNAKLISQISIGSKELLLQGRCNFAALRKFGKECFNLLFTLANQAEEQVISLCQPRSRDVGTEDRQIVRC